MEDILRSLGVTANTLLESEKSFLDQKGYLPLKGLFVDQLEQLRSRTETLLRKEGDNAGWELQAASKGAVQNRKDEGTDRLSNLVDKGAEFSICYTHPRVLAAIAHVLQSDFRLSSLNYRASLPGHGLQPLHVDWKVAVDAENYQVCNSIWLLDDFTSQNGATRIVPGSHLWGNRPQEVMPDTLEDHTDQIPLLGKAGTVIVFNSHTWHGGTQNNSEFPRRAIHSYFCRRHQPQQTNQKEFVRAQTLKGLSEEVRYLLDA